MDLNSYILLQFMNSSPMRLKQLGITPSAVSQNISKLNELRFYHLFRPVVRAT